VWTLKEGLTENGGIVVAGIIAILGLVNQKADLISFFVGSSLVLLYFYKRIPTALDRYFKTNVFRRDFSLRLSLVVFPLTMFSTFSLFYAFVHLFLPQLLHIVEIPYGFEIAVSTNVMLVFVFITFYSWRLWRYPEAALRLWRKSSSSQKEFEWDVERSKNPGKLPSLNRFMSPGVTPTAIAVLLFLALLILSMFDILLIGFLLLWLGHNLLCELRQRQTEFRKQNAIAFRFFRLFDQTVTWEGMLNTGLRGSVSGIWDAFVLLMCFILLVIPSLSSLAGFLVMFGLLGSWYLVIVLAQIMRRLGTMTRKAVTDPSKLHVLPLHKDLALSATFSLIAVFSILMSYEFFEANIRLGILVGASVSVNAISLLSVWRWKRERERLTKIAEWKTDRDRDRYRIDAIFWFSGLPIALIGWGARGLLFWTMFSGSVILLSLSGKILSRSLKSSPGTLATSRTLYMTVVVCLILGSAAWFFPELSSILEALAALLAVLLVIMWVLFYKWREYSIQKERIGAGESPQSCGFARTWLVSCFVSDVRAWRASRCCECSYIQRPFLKSSNGIVSLDHFPRRMSCSTYS
jgi:hypothetical protein